MLLFTTSGGVNHAYAVQFLSGVTLFEYFVNTSGQVIQVLPPPLLGSLLSTFNAPTSEVAPTQKTTSGSSKLCETFAHELCGLAGFAACIAVVTEQCEEKAGPILGLTPEAVLACIAVGTGVCSLAYVFNVPSPGTGGLGDLACEHLVDKACNYNSQSCPSGLLSCFSCAKSGTFAPTSISTGATAITCNSPYSCQSGACTCSNVCQGTLGSVQCCSANQNCISETCVTTCAAGETPCGTTCCSSGEICANGTCTACPSGTVICGSTCCPSGACFGNKCQQELCQSCSDAGLPCCVSGDGISAQCCSSGEICCPKQHQGRNLSLSVRWHRFCLMAQSGCGTRWTW